ncbi:mitochondrial 54S ribosomal protein mL46 NDAI_0F04020 [Naumovozyma dairenensis CBS 421]|uniref:Large ribosomal subunit protein mL46 n=1 Tax=Naumovozyma dairenensis (strain ATCC 10597 / BCRC 20456 / CBS 421 / NBRC 0211 / NRRL Y-12639) TaxID=1071378 RepID=G0WD59_NAUDC|nr:hypothetical protein NDAI_0F04020 [Naumovozyma dairenensis CBS 421]CCD25720.1 hypothetical protein NDAI_0F04020 [Naumovozyma dairenensis CBS 421]
MKRTLSKTTATPIIRSAMILSRIPIVVRELTKLESNYYKYQSELEKRLMWTFPDYYYFKKGSLSEHKFIKAQNYPVSKIPGVWYPHGIPDIKRRRERRSKQEIVLPRDKIEDDVSLVGSSGSTKGSTDGAKGSISRPIVPNDLKTEADKKGNLQTVERELSRTLYLLVQDENLGWKFPSFVVEGNDKGLHDIAEQAIKSLSQNEINTWLVSKTPVAVFEDSDDGSYEFFLKSHILAGTFAMKDNTFKQFAWLTKDEIKNHVTEQYFRNVEFLLAN